MKYFCDLNLLYIIKHTVKLIKNKMRIFEKNDFKLNFYGAIHLTRP